jgi:hypothetical protein
VGYYSKCKLKHNQEVFFKELKVKHLKILYKCLIGEEVDADTLIFNLNFILNIVVKNIPPNIDFLDYFILLLEIRILSIGNKITLQLKEDTTLEVNLEQFSNILKSTNTEDLLKPEIMPEGITFYFRLPSISEVSFFCKNQEDLIYNFLDKIQIKNQIYNKDEFHSQRILNILPAKFFAIINKRIQKIISYFNKINLLSYNEHIKGTELYFNFNIHNLVLLIKLLFGNHLMVLYENIFALCKIANFTPEYIENCSPGEYILFVKKLEEFNKSSSESSDTSHDLAPDMFGESVFEEPLNPYESPNLPPVTSQFTG